LRRLFAGEVDVSDARSLSFGKPIRKDMQHGPFFQLYVFGIVLGKPGIGRVFVGKDLEMILVADFFRRLADDPV
jgi:hypothetical protein